MQKRTVRNITSILLLGSMVICFMSGIIKWPFLIQNIGISYRDIPMTVITDIHDWSGLLAGLLTLIHLIQYRHVLQRMIRLPKEAR